MDLNDYISAGYYITHYVNRPDYCDATLLPPKILSLSTCIADFFPDDWCLDWVKIDEKDREENALTFGLKKSNLKQVIDSLTSRFDHDFGYNNVCYSPQIAQNLIKEFSLDKNNLTFIGVGIHQSIKEELIAEMTPPPQKEGYAPMGTAGALEMVLRNEELASDAQILGFELINIYLHWIDHSWLCNGLEQEVKKRLEIAPNKHGFIDNFEDALRSCEHISKDEVGAEEGLWIPILITQYSLEN